jgi:hypothetical protein
MKKVLLLIVLLSISNTVFANLIEKCAPVALAAPLVDGYTLESNKYSTIYPGMGSYSDFILYVIHLNKKDGENKKVAGVSTSFNCQLTSVIYYDVK